MMHPKAKYYIRPPPPVAPMACTRLLVLIMSKTRIWRKFYVLFVNFISFIFSTINSKKVQWQNCLFSFKCISDLIQDDADLEPEPWIHTC